MAKPILLDRRVILGGHRISRDANRVGFGPIGRTRVPAETMEVKSGRYELGRWQGEFTIQGYTDEELEARFLAELAKTTAPTTPLTMFLEPGNGAAGEMVAQMSGCAFDINFTGEQGQLQGFEISGSAHDRGMIGEILRSSIGTAGITGIGDGTAVNLGAISATQKMVVIYHLLNFPAAEGTTPTLDHKIQSATDEPFTTPADRAVLTQLTDTPVGLVAEIAGPVTDTWWRHSVTAVGGTGTPKLWVVVSAAIITA